MLFLNVKTVISWSQDKVQNQPAPLIPPLPPIRIPLLWEQSRKPSSNSKLLDVARMGRPVDDAVGRSPGITCSHELHSSSYVLAGVSGHQDLLLYSRLFGGSTLHMFLSHCTQDRTHRFLFFFFFFAMLKTKTECKPVPETNRLSVGPAIWKKWLLSCIDSLFCFQVLLLSPRAAN